MQVVDVRAGLDGSTGVLMLHAGQAAAHALGTRLTGSSGAGVRVLAARLLGRMLWWKCISDSMVMQQHGDVVHGAEARVHMLTAESYGTRVGLGVTQRHDTVAVRGHPRLGAAQQLLLLLPDTPPPAGRVVAPTRPACRFPRTPPPSAPRTPAKPGQCQYVDSAPCRAPARQLPVTFRKPLRSTLSLLVRTRMSTARDNTCTAWQRGAVQCSIVQCMLVSVVALCGLGNAGRVLSFRTQEQGERMYEVGCLASGRWCVRG